MLMIIDTSSILFGFANKKDVFAIAKSELPSYTQLISVGIMNELFGISKNSGKRGASAKAAIEALKYKKVAVDNNTRSVDSWILSKSQENSHTVVITNDTELYKKLKGNNTKVLKLTRDGSLR